MNVSAYMKKYNLTDEHLDAIAAQYESGEYPNAGGTVYRGSHLDAVDKSGAMGHRVYKLSSVHPASR